MGAEEAEAEDATAVRNVDSPPPTDAADAVHRSAAEEGGEISVIRSESGVVTAEIGFDMGGSGDGCVREEAPFQGDASRPTRRGGSSASRRALEEVEGVNYGAILEEIGVEIWDAEAVASRSGVSGEVLPRQPTAPMTTTAASANIEHIAQPGAVYVRRRAGRVPTFFHRFRSGAQGDVQRSLQAPSLLDRTASSASSFSLSGGRRQQSRHSDRLPPEESPNVVEVTTAELAPGEAARGSGVWRSVTSGGDAVAQWHAGGCGGSATILEGVPVPGPEEARGRRRTPIPCCPFRGHSKLLYAAVAVVALAVVITIAVVLSVQKRAESRSMESGPANKDLLLEILEQISSLEALNDTQSPQGRAFLWLMEDGNFWSLPSSSAPSILDDPPRLLQRYALAVLYYSTGGPMSWVRQLSFLSSKHECEWRLESKGVICNNSSDVVELQFSLINLTGTLPGPGLAAFPSLNILNMESNNLSGAIPSGLGTLQSLRIVKLGRNSLSGPLMENIGDLGTLERLHISFNNLNSTIPPSIGQLHLLERLDFKGNLFTGSIPSTIGNLSSLKVLNFNFNRLSSTIPPSWTSLDQLEEFYIEGNELSGPLPVDPTGSQNLKWIFAGSNYLTGTIPSSLGSLPQLSVMLMLNNQLHGSIPETLSNLTQLEALSVGSNNVNGTIPAGIFRGGKLMAIGVGDNQLTGTLPNDIGNPSGLLLVSAERNFITGTIPSTYGNLPSLLALSLYGNHLSGTIPTSLGNNTESLGLMLENNMLTGTLPQSLANLNKAMWMSFARNDLTGNLNSVCAANIFEARIVTADCAPLDVEVHCDCCICCNDAVDGCDYHVDVTTYAKNCLSDGSCDFFSNKPGNP